MLLVISPSSNLLTGNKIMGQISVYKSLIWNEQYVGFDEFELTLPFAEDTLSLLQVGYVLARVEELQKNKRGAKGSIIFNPFGPDSVNGLFDVGIDFHPMVIETIQITEEEETGKMVKVSGRGVKSFYNRRAVSTINVSLGEIGEALTAQNEIAFAVSDSEKPQAQWSKRFAFIPQFSGVNYYDEDFTLRERAWKWSTAKKKVEITTTAQKVGDWISAAGEAYGFGWTVAMIYRMPTPDRVGDDADMIYFVLAPYTGLNLTGNGEPVVEYDHSITKPPIKFTRANEMLLKSSYTYDKREYCNQVKVFGEGEGLNQTIETFTTDPTARGIDLFEDSVDGSSVRSEVVILENEYRALLRAYGKEQIAAKGSGFSFECDVNQLTAKLIYGDSYDLARVTFDYSLGDRVEVENELGIMATARINEIIRSEDESGLKIVPTFGEWKIE